MTAIQINEDSEREHNSLVEKDTSLLVLPLPAGPMPNSASVYRVSDVNLGTVHIRVAPRSRSFAPVHSHWKREGEVKLTIMELTGGVPSWGRVKERVRESWEEATRVGADGALSGTERGG